jgi:replicative DNA helicase
MTASLEVLFFAYILENPKYFKKILPTAYKNDQIRFVYGIVRNHYLGLKTPQVPSPKKIVELLRIEDVESKMVSNEFLRELLTTNLSEVIQNETDDWLEKKLRSWGIVHDLKSRMMEAIEDLRKVDQVDYNNVMDVTNKIKDLIGNASLTDYGDDDLGADFDDPTSHLQDSAAEKITTGWKSIDSLLNGGWDRKTLNLLIAESNAGKSLWMGNIAVHAANAGKNVVYVSLEMSQKKVMKRLGAARLRININEYDEKSKDMNFIKQRIQQLHSNGASGDAFGDVKVGKIFVKEFPTGTATVHDVDDYIKQLIEKKGIKPDMIIIDYLTIMNPGVGNKNGTLYTNGKALAEGVRALGQKYDAAVISAVQIAKDAFGENDLMAKDISESKAILETADLMFGIIRTEAMKKAKKYVLKLLKIRDGEFRWLKTGFDLNVNYLTIENDTPFPD